MTAIDQWVGHSLTVLACWILISGLDDVFLDCVWLCHWLSRRVFHGACRPEDESAVTGLPEKRIALLVPCWQEDRVIGNMVRRNVAGIRYQRYDLFLGAYPNDGPTLAAVHELEIEFPNVHAGICGANGPTSKADCLNWLYRKMLDFENETGSRFDVIVTHDAEDIIHPLELHWLNYYIDTHDMVQIPVLPLRRSVRDLTSGLYADEFAEFQLRDMPGRQILGGFIPSNGVGTGFSRWAMDKLAEDGGQIFDRACLTEDYENGIRVHALRCPQLFVPIHFRDGEPMATREYFPHTIKDAIKQRTRWVTGIALQTWERHGWNGGWGTKYWLWRDRKCLIGNPVSALALCVCVYGLATFGLTRALPAPPWLVRITIALTVIHLAVRMGCSARIYGWRFALLVPLRAVLGIWINFRATIGAIRRYAGARLRREPLVWLKTSHSYPASPVREKRRLGEILVAQGKLGAVDLSQALGSQPPGVRIGGHLMSRGAISESDLYQALSVQSALPLTRLDPRRVSPAIARSLPAHVVTGYRVLPYQTIGGSLFLATPEIPEDSVTAGLSEFTKLDVRLALVTSTNFDALCKELL